MSAPRKPRLKRVTLAGTVDAAGFVFDTALIGETVARARILRLLDSGASVVRFGKTALVLRLGGVKTVHCESAPGLPLIKLGPTLASLPLSPAQISALSAPENSVVIARAGELVVWKMADGESIDPASWLELDGFSASVATAIALPPPPIETQPPALAPLGPVDMRTSLGVDAAPSEQARVADALFAPSPDAQTPGLRSRVADMLAGAADSLEKLSDRGGPGGADSSENAGNADGFSLTEWLDSLSDRLRLNDQIGGKNAEYVEKMLDLFEKGQWDEALRHGIPLARPDDPSGTGDNAPPGDFRARDRAELSPRDRAPRSGGHGDSERFERLRKTYRDAFEKLKAEGKIEEAAYVLAELLRDHAAAVDFLDRNDRSRLAAEMAEARKMPVEQIVRLWWKAGETGRALAIARRYDCFFTAVSLLERRGEKDAARALRREWATRRADAGDYVGAIETASTLPDSAEIIRPWLEKAIALGGTIGAKMLARTFDTDDMGERKARRADAIGLLNDASSETAAERLAFSRALVELSPQPDRTTLARAAARAHLRDVASGVIDPEPQLLRALTQKAGDGALRADLPTLPSARIRPIDSELVFSHRVPSSDRGAGAIDDIVLLPDGRVLVALGMQGVRLLTRDGRVAAHFDTPADQLILSDFGDRVLAIRAIGERVRVVSIDLLTRKIVADNDLGIVAWADTFDGGIWLVASETSLLALDALDANFRVLWRCDELSGRIALLSRNATDVSVLVADDRLVKDGGPLYFRVDTLSSSLRTDNLRSKSVPLHRLPQIGALALDGVGNIAAGWVGPESAPSLTAWLRGDEWQRDPGEPGETPIALALNVGWIALARRSLVGVVVDIFTARSTTGPSGKIAPLAPIATIALDGAETARLRLAADQLLVTDNLGRLLQLDLNDRKIARDLRLKG